MSHLQESTVEQGLDTYLARCATSGLPAVKAIAEKYESLDRDGQLALYVETFGEGASWSAEPMSEVEQLRARLAQLEGNAPSAPATAPTGFVKGGRFTYRNKAGNATEHTIMRVAKKRVFTNRGLNFKIATLEKLSSNGSGIVTVL